MTVKPIDQIIRESGVTEDTELKHLTEGLKALDKNSDGHLATYEAADEDGYLTRYSITGKWRYITVGPVENALFKAGIVSSDIYVMALVRDFLAAMPLDRSGRPEWIKKKGDELAGYLSKPLKSETKLEIAVALVLSGRKDGVDAVMSQVRQLRLDSENAQGSAVSKLREVAWNDQIQDALIKLSASGEKIEVRRLAALALGGAHSEQSVGVLSKLLDDPDFTVRLNAARSLAGMAFRGNGGKEPGREIGKTARALLTKKAVKGDAMAAAVLARAEVWEKGMMPALVKATQDKNPVVREIAEKGVLQLRTGDEITSDEAKALLGEER